MTTAKVFKSGNSQAIRLPKEFQFNTDKVQLNRVGNLIIIISDEDKWASFKEGVEEAIDFPEVIDLAAEEPEDYKP